LLLSREDFLVNHSSKLALLGLSLALAACSSLEGDKVDYKGSAAKKTPSLAIPPDLSQLPNDTRYATPGATVTASGYQTVAQPNPTTRIAAPSIGDVRIERAGTQRWLVVDRPTDKLWDPIKGFWQENGFQLVMDQPSLGIMETDWAENRSKLPQDFIRGTFGKLFDGLYSTGERDKFRTRLERNAAGGTEVYISHRGMMEVYSDQEKGQTVWQPRAVDPELEAEFLRRLMVKIGLPQEQSSALIAAAAQPKLSSRLVEVDNQPVVQMDEGFDRAWRRVGLSLDRTGFTVEDRDRSKGTYFVRYVDPSIDKTEPGFFSKLFGSTANVSTPQKYRIAVRGQGDSSRVLVLNASGENETSDNARRILKVLVDDLK
jgi:outer membrane protein assembly factor BamC